MIVCLLPAFQRHSGHSDVSNQQLHRVTSSLVLSIPAYLALLPLPKYSYSTKGTKWPVWTPAHCELGNVQGTPMPCSYRPLSFLLLSSQTDSGPRGRARQPS